MSPRPCKEIPLATKVAQVFEAVGKLQRNGTHPDGWKWTRASDVLEAVRDKLFKKGVLILPSESKPEYVPIATSNAGEQITECRLAVTYTFMDAQSSLPPITINGAGRDVEDRAVYKAQTGAQKALLKRFGLMAEEQDDPEFTGRREDQHEASDEILRDAPRQPRTAKTVTLAQIHTFNAACSETNKSQDEVSGYLLTTHRVAKLSDLGRGKPFTSALQWAREGQRVQHPKPQATQAAMSFPTPAPPEIELRIGNKTVSWEPEKAKSSYAL